MKLQIPYLEFEFQFMRSRGPGGQNVNKTNSACLLRWRPGETLCVNLEQREYLLHRLAGDITEAGEILVRSDQFRDQEANKKACIERLHQKVEQALFKAKARKKTKPKKSAVRKRLKGKEIRGEVKALRRKPAVD